MNKEKIIKQLREMAKHPTVTLPRDCEALKAAADLIEQAQEPVAVVAEVHMSRYTIEWTNGPLPEGTQLYISPPQQKQEPVAMQMDVIVVNLVREGINKHRARELAEHFIKHTSPPQRQPLTEWRPIETAPKNESILVWGKWFAYPFQAGFKNGRLVTAGNVVVDEATHWMPLPNAPIEAAHGIKGEA